MPAVIFDQDGILTDTEGLQWQGWLEVLKPFGIKIPKQEYIEKYAGKTGAIVEKGIIAKYGLKTPVGSLLKQKGEWLMRWFRANEIPLMPYAREAVYHFARKGIKLAVASSGSREEVELKLKKTGLLGMFAVIATRDDVKRGKPFPDIYIFAARQLGVKPEDCIVFEDTEYGIASAKSAGMICIAVPGEFSMGQDLSKADAMLPNLREAVEYAKKKYGL